MIKHTYKKKTKVNVLRVFFNVAPKVIKVSPWIFLFSFILNLIDGTISGSMIFFTQQFLEKAEGLVEHRNSIKVVIYAMVIWGSLQLVWQMINGISYLVNMMYLRKARGYLSMEIHEKISRLAPICYERSEVLDDINKAEQGKDCAATFVNAIIITLSVHIPYFLYTGIFLYHVQPILMVLLLLIFIPTILTQLLRAKEFGKTEDNSAPLRRECFYYEDCITGREYFKETRILGAFTYFKSKYVDLLETLNKLTYYAYKKSNIAELVMKLLSLVGYIGILLLLVDLTMRKKISIASFAAIYGTVGQMFSRMEGVVYRLFGSLAHDFGMVRNYINFLHLEEQQGVDNNLEKNEDIVLDNVSFSYPGSNKKAINSINLTVHSGEIVAIVGENGSGKSTLVRLITGLYLPDSGDVFIGNANTRDISTASLYKNTSAVFQKYQKYQMTMKDNITISETDKFADDKYLDDICSQAGVDKNNHSFINGYETMLSREFDGTDLSGGQWQRIAIARCLFRTHHIIILDEPTAAIDPIEESKIYNYFVEISKGNTVFIITHRLGSVKFANKILVMKDGKLIEQGNHEKLMKANNEYMHLYKSQEQWYKP